MNRPTTVLVSGMFAAVLVGGSVAAAGRALVFEPASSPTSAATSTTADGDDPPGHTDDGAGDASGRARAVATSTSTTSSTSTTVVGPVDDDVPVRDGGAVPRRGVVDAAGAGTVTYEFDGATFVLHATVAAPGWRATIESASGTEIDVDFRSATHRVQVDIELEDGAVRERVRVRDEVTGDHTETTGADGDADTTAGDSSGRDDEHDDDRRGSGHDGGDDRGDDDRGGRSGSSDD